MRPRTSGTFRSARNYRAPYRHRSLASRRPLLNAHGRSKAGLAKTAYEKLGIPVDQQPQDLITIPWAQLGDAPQKPDKGDILRFRPKATTGVGHPGRFELCMPRGRRNQFPPGAGMQLSRSRSAQNWHPVTGPRLRATILVFTVVLLGCIIAAKAAAGSLSATSLAVTPGPNSRGHPEWHALRGFMYACVLESG